MLSCCNVQYNKKNITNYPFLAPFAIIYYPVVIQTIYERNQAFYQ